MIAYLKSTLKLPTIGWIVDTGTYLGIGNSIVNKDLTLTGLDRKFIPYTGTGAPSGNSYSVNPVIYDSTTTGSNLMLTGNNCMLQMRYLSNINNSASYLQSYAKPGGWQTFCYGSTAPYFTSTQGLTNGNTYIIIGNEFSQVLVDGTLVKLNSAMNVTTSSTGHHCNIIAENSNFFVCLENINGSYTANGYNQANFRFFTIAKFTWVVGFPGILTNSKQYWYSAPKFMGITGDNKVLIACYPVPSTGAISGVYGTLYYYIYDLNLNTISQSTTGTLIHSANNVTTCSVPSNMSQEVSDKSKNKYYIASCKTNAPTTISRIMVPNVLCNKIYDNNITDPSMGGYSATGFNTTTNIITANNNFVANQPITFSAVFGNITIGTTYYISATNLSSTGFSVSATSGGSIYALIGTSTLLPGLYNSTNYTTATFNNANYITLANPAGLILGSSDFTIECWFKCDTTPVSATIYSGRPASTNGAYPHIYIDASSNLYYLVSSTNRILAGTISANVWYHVAVVRNGGFTKMYLNGTQAGATYTDATVYVGGAGRPSIGTDGYTLGTSSLMGSIYNFRVVTGVSGAVYTSNFIPPLTPLTAVAGTQLLAFQSATIVDNSTNAYPITKTGTLTPSLTPMSYYYTGSGLMSSNISCLPTTCTTPGLITNIPHPNLSPNTTTSTGTAACIYLNQLAVNNKEYVVTLTMGYANITGTGGYNNIAPSTMYNGCGVAAHTLTVFQIDPTNSANLIYKSAITDGTAFGTNNVLFNFNASADNTKLVLSNETQFVILTWDPAAESYSYSRTYTISDGIGRISLDTTNQLWIHSNTTSNVYLYTLNGAINAEINYTNGIMSLDYTSTNLTTNVIANSFITQQSTKYYNTYFNSNSYMIVPDSTGLNLAGGAYTIEGWVNPTSFPVVGMLITKRQLFSPYTASWGVYLTTGTGVLQFYNGTSYSSGIAPILNNWNHFAAVYNGTSISLFLNGIRVLAPTAVGNVNTPATINIGGDTVPGVEGLNGYLSSIRVVKGTAIYSGTTYTVPSFPLTAITGTQLLTCLSSAFTDLSSNNATISAVGGASTQLTSQGASTVGRQIGNVELSVSGPATFTSTGTTSATVATSATADTTIGLTITGSGAIAVVPTGFTITPTTTTSPVTTSPPTTTVQPTNDPYRNYVALHMKNTGTNTGSVTSVDNTQHLDSSTTPLTIYNNGNVVQSNFGPYLPNYSTRFDGASYFNLSAPASLVFGTNGFTIEGWFNSSTIGVRQVLIDFRAAQGLFPCLYLETTGLISYYVNSTVVITSTGVSVVADTWNHFALVKSAGSTKLYLNGTQVGVTYTDANTYGCGASRPLIGTTGSLIVLGSFTGFMSNIRVVTGTAVYTANFTPPTAALTAIAGTQLLMCQANRFIDSSASANAITVTSSPVIDSYNPFAAISSYSSSVYGGSGMFNGNTSYLNVLDGSATTLATNNFTIEGWVYLNGLMGSGNIIYDARPIGITGFYPVIYIPAANTMVFHVNNVDVITSSALLPATWYHVAVVKNNGITKMFLNGGQAGVSYTDTNTYYCGINRPTIGADGNAQLTRFFNGYIANLRVLNGTALYTTAFTPPTSLLTNIANTALLFNFNNFNIATNTNNNTIIDSSSNKNAISSLGNGINTVVGQGSFNPYEPSYSTYFNGTSYLNSVTNTGLAIGTVNFTIEGWFNPSAIGTQQYLIDFRAAAAVSPSIYIETTGLISYQVNAAVAITSTGVSVIANTWNHFALVKSAGSTKLYLNGTQVGVTYADANTYVVGAARPIIGTYGITPNTVNFTGFMSNIRVVTGTAVYTANFAPPTAALTAIAGTQLLTCQSNRFMDVSANKAAFTVTGTPYIQGFIPFTATYNPTNNSGSIFCNNTALRVQHNNTLKLGSSNFTVEMWVYPTNFATIQTLLYLNGSTTGGAGSLACNINTTGTVQTLVSTISTGWSVNNTSTLTVTKNCWNHIAVVRNGTSIITYINGVSAISQTLAGSLYEAVQTIIGAYTPTTTTYGQLFNGTYITDFNILVGTAKYTTTFTPSITPITSTANTALLLNGTNSGLYDSSMNTSLQTLTSTTNQVTVNTTTTKFNTGSTYFNGINSYLISDYKPQLLLNNNFTIEMWVNGSSTRGVISTLLSKNATYTSANNYFICYKHAMAPNTISIWLSPQSNAPICSSTTPLLDNSWYHIAVVRNNNLVTLYINGNPEASFGNGGVWDYSLLSIGNNAGDAPTLEAFGGYIDDLRITNGIARYTTQFIPSNQPLQVQ